MIWYFNKYFANSVCSGSFPGWSFGGLGFEDKDVCNLLTSIIYLSNIFKIYPHSWYSDLFCRGMVLGWEYGGHLKHAETPLCLCGNSLQVIFPGSTGATCHDLKSWNTPLRLEPKLLVFSWSERMHHFMDVWWKYARFMKRMFENNFFWSL